VRKVIFPLILVAVILVGSTQSFAALVQVKLVVDVGLGTWVMEAEDIGSTSTNLGIFSFGFNLVGSGGTTITLQDQNQAGTDYYQTAPLAVNHAGSGSGSNYPGFSYPIETWNGTSNPTASLNGNYDTGTQVDLNFVQGHNGTSVTVNNAVYEIGQPAHSGNGKTGNANGSFSAYTTAGGTTMGGQQFGSGGDNIANYVIFAQGTFTGNANSLSLSGLDANVFNATQGTGTTAAANTAQTIANGGLIYDPGSTNGIVLTDVPEPASLCLLAMGGLLALSRRRRMLP
jgi:hypothetical protein